MPPRRRSIEAGQPADAPPGKAAPAPAAAEKRRSIPRPNLETAIRWAAPDPGMYSLHWAPWRVHELRGMLAQIRCIASLAVRSAGALSVPILPPLVFSGEAAEVTGTHLMRGMPTHARARRLKSYVGNAIDHASSVPAWLASKAVPVAADGAGLLKHAAADAVDRVALFRRGWGAPCGLLRQIPGCPCRRLRPVCRARL